MTTKMLDRPDFHAAIAHVFQEKIPFCKALGLKFRIVGHRAEVSFAKQDFMLGNTKMRVLHGGVTAAVLDSIAGIAILCRMAELHPKADVPEQLREFGRISTIDLRVDYLEPAGADAFVATAEVIRLGRRVANVQMRMVDSADKCVATGTAAFALRSLDR